MSRDSRHDEPEAGRDWGAIIGWGAYLGCSWTWCIGMFLPVLLIRDYGPWAMVVFAVPNIVGAAAMGFVLKRPVDVAWRKRHEAALAWFMRVTLVFQWFFLGMVGASVGAKWLAIGPFGVALAWKLCRGWWRWMGMGTWLVSLGCAALYMNELHIPIAGMLERSPRHAPMDLLWLGPVCVFGFGLCPYLDLTFHRARGALESRAARWAFGLGFGFFFASMIGFTWMYAPLLIDRGVAGLSVRLATAMAVAVHMTVQVGFTTCAFVEAEDHARGARVRIAPRILTTVAAGIAYGLGGEFVGRGPLGENTGEVIYRCFMAFYGLVFPAYVWLCVIGGVGERVKRLAVFGGAVLLAAPCYWLGFIEGRAVWLVPGLLIVLGARLLIRDGRSATRSAAGPEAPART